MIFQILTFCVLVLSIQALELTPQVVFETKWINFSFPTVGEWEDYVDAERYRNVTLNGIKVDRSGNIYGGFPRWKWNVPMTIGKLNTETNAFEAYPTWEMNQIDRDNPMTLDSVLGFEIDSMNRMWILDQSHINSENPCPVNGSKLIIYDMDQEEIIRVEIFDDSIAPRDSSFLNDLVVDMERNVAYIADSGIMSEPPSPALIYYDFNTRQMKRLLVSQPSTLPNDTLRFSTDGNLCFENAAMMTGIDGIALTCDFSRLYYCPLTSHKVYGIETSFVRDLSNVDDKIVEIGDKRSISDGLILGSKGNFFAGGIELNSVVWAQESAMKEILLSGTDNLGEIPGITEFAIDADNIWQDTFSLSNGALYWVSNNLCNWLNGYLNYNEINYRIYMVAFGESSYVEGCESGASEMIISIIFMFCIALIII